MSFIDFLRSRFKCIEKSLLLKISLREIKAFPFKSLKNSVTSLIFIMTTPCSRRFVHIEKCLLENMSRTFDTLETAVARTEKKSSRSTIGPKYQLINLDRRFLVRSDRLFNSNKKKRNDLD